MNTRDSVMYSTMLIPLTWIGRRCLRVLRLEKTFQKLGNALDDFLE
jgi:hypothetical protein